MKEKAIDRRSLVTRHAVRITRPDPLSPLSLGNGEFAFTADITGLQTFPAFHKAGIPLCTQSQWGWHSAPNPNGYRLEDSLADYTTFDGRRVSYPYEPRNEKFEDLSPALKWLIQNPNRLNLGQAGLALGKADGNPATIDDLTEMDQCLDLWCGKLNSSFSLEGILMHVETCVHPGLDMLAVRIKSDLLTSGQSGVKFAFGYPDPDDLSGNDFTKPGRHTTEISNAGTGMYNFIRKIDDTSYAVMVRVAKPVKVTQTAGHEFVFTTASDSLEMVIAFSPEETLTALPGFDETECECRTHWQRFWATGGAVDLSESSDPRAMELERRIVLSQYLTAIQCAGSMPPQESGLTHNSWHGKFHLEMHWWHAAHFALWGRAPLLEKSLPWYRSIMPSARKCAERQGYRGVRWPKMVGPDGRECPSWIGPFLIWQQPHLIFFAELLWRTCGEKEEVLEQYRDLVFETAEFMASFPVRDSLNSRFILGPPLCPAQEACIFLPGRHEDTVINPSFELEYWAFGLSLAQEWRLRLGLSRESSWDEILEHLSRPSVFDGAYLASENTPDSFSNIKLLCDHPSVLAAYGILPGMTIDPETMRRTLHLVLEKWQWQGWTWGWDYPMTAMCASRLGETDEAVNILLMETPANHWLSNGHCFQGEKLPTYLPANGGLLYAAAFMAAGWDGAPVRNAPGFPEKGWVVRWEGLNKSM